MLRLRILALAACGLCAAPAWAETAKSESIAPAAAATAAAPAPAPASAATSTAAPAEVGQAAIKQAAAEPIPAQTEPKAEAKAEVKPAAPETTLKVSIDLASQSMVVSEHGHVVHTWPISSGTQEFPTPRGSFRPQWTAKMWYSRKYDNAPMPHAVFINGGVAIHATYHTRALGRPASHGCIRLAPGNAKTFYGLVHRHGLKSTRVSVYGTPKFGSAVAQRSAPQKRRLAAASAGGSDWSWGGASSSAYAPNFVKPKYRAAAPRPSQALIYPGDAVPRGYRRAQGPRVVYAPRGNRRAYYNGYGYGYGGGW